MVMNYGENSLKYVSGVPEPDYWTWEEIGEAFTDHKFTGFTLLRLGNECWDQEKDKFEVFIKEYDNHRRAS